ncbi:MAG TPA: FAD-dependent monooxygenase [Pseudonocardiaceae bacterium]|jgi:2-polyprenyl-6-methoxyphenol hydroxylase-like FAD-dependent oxidoreductase|nr:FAD-dependent monooxygenase [Pseudonocardiaceae bacterium]
MNGNELPERTSVLIVGAGPAGLAAAVTLAESGVDAVVLDQLDEAANTSRAAVVHARTLEVLDELGLADELIAKGEVMGRFVMFDGPRKVASISFDGLPTRYPFALMVPQDVTEATLLAKLRSLGNDVHRPYRVSTVDNRADGVTVTATDASGVEHTITADYLIGADGMHSVVREQAGIGFTGGRYAESFVLADVRMTWPVSRTDVTLHLSTEGITVVAPLPGDRFRVVATVAEAPQHPTADDIQAILRARGPQGTIEVHDVAWSSRFHVHHRVADHFRAGRILLAGDAAHVHSPAGGQGMNTGIQDAVALGRLLFRALNGEDVLDEYETTRRPVALGVVAFTDRMTRMATVTSAPLRAARDIALPVLTRVPALRRRIAYQLAELGNR